MRHIQFETIWLTPLLLSLSGCGGMSDSDAREMADSESLRQSSADGMADSSARKAASTDDAASLDAHDGADSHPQEMDTLGRNEGDLIVVVKLDDTADVTPPTDASANTTLATSPPPAPVPASPAPMPVISDAPTILGSYSDGPITAESVAAETWVPVEGLAGLEASNVALEVVDDLSVLIIFDNSGSMDTHWDGRTRWEVANLAIYESLAPVRTSLKVAAVRFPMEVECGVPEFDSNAQFGWELAGDFLDQWIERALAPAGGTPLGQAFIAADAAIAEASERGLLKDRFNVLLITDGEPNCATEAGLLTELPAKWLEKGVETHVLGLPGSSQAQQLLNDIAVAGGTAEPIAIDSAEELGHEVLVRAR